MADRPADPVCEEFPDPFGGSDRAACGGVIARHARILAARQLGIAEVPVMVARGWSDAQKRAYVIARRLHNGERCANLIGRMGGLIDSALSPRAGDEHDTDLVCVADDLPADL
jgi:hypothetical protein